MQICSVPICFPTNAHENPDWLHWRINHYVHKAFIYKNTMQQPKVCVHTHTSPITVLFPIKVMCINIVLRIIHPAPAVNALENWHKFPPCGPASAAELCRGKRILWTFFTYLWMDLSPRLCWLCRLYIEIGCAIQMRYLQQDFSLDHMWIVFDWSHWSSSAECSGCGNTARVISKLIVATKLSGCGVNYKQLSIQFRCVLQNISVLLK